MATMYDRTKLLIDDLDKIKKLNICICGLGGVGSYTFETLVRCGVGNVTVIDNDKIDITNINRQLLALNSTVGMYKVEVASKRAKDINKEVNIIEIKEKITKENINELLNTKYDYILDCIDDVTAKLEIIKYAKKNNIKIISSMGTANKLDPTKIQISEISKTTMCPLARKIRQELKKIGISDLKVVYSTEESIKNKGLGSVPYVPSIAGIYITSEIIDDTIR